MFKLFLLFSFLTNTTLALACQIESYAKIVIIKDSQHINYIKESNCGHGIKQKFNQTMATMNGVVPASALVSMLGEEAEVSPFKIELVTLADLLNEKYKNTNLKIENFQWLGPETYIGLNQSDKVSISSDDIERMGEQNLKITVEETLSGLNKNFHLRAQISRFIKAYRAKQNISSSTNESSLDSMVSLEEIAVTKPENYLTHIADLKFYKINKNISAGEWLRSSDVSPITLVKAGNRVKVKIQNAALNLTSVGIANRSAHIGETLELTNVNSKKKIVGKVIDFNTVVIEL